MQETLELYLKDGSYYYRTGITALRPSKDELRWINSRGQKDGMAFAFLEKYVHTVEVSK